MLFGFRLVIDKVFIFDDLSIRKTVFYVNEITTAIIKKIAVGLIG